MVNSSPLASQRAFVTVTEQLQIGEFLERAWKGTLIDVRSTAEFDHGHIPHAISVPLMTDEERAAVGTRYKTEGRLDATVLGLGFVGPRLAQLAHTLIHMSEKGDLFIYCARGGMRSGSVAWLANLLQLHVYVLEGGYRSYRQWLDKLWEKPWSLRVLGGLTGVGKTQLLHSLKAIGAQVIDLEGLANHKGSAFGGVLEAPQPTQSQFENELGHRLFGLNPELPIWIEDESKLIGHRAIPPVFWTQMRIRPVLYVSRPLQFRIDLLAELYGEADPNLLLECTSKISRRLGPENTAIAQAAIQSNDLSKAIALVLEYYDKTYRHGLSKRQKVHHFELHGLVGTEAAHALQHAWIEGWGETDKSSSSV
ncbi:MAG: tRNA 2-selenouridine(34) synthase MnmH [Myxococcota bacterium]